MTLDLASEFVRKFDRLRWSEAIVVDQVNLIKEYIEIRTKITVTQVGSIELGFQKKLHISRDEWFRILASNEVDRLKILKLVWSKNATAKTHIEVPSGHDKTLYPQSGWLGDFVFDYSRVIESPDSFLFWSGVSAIAATARRHVHVQFGARKIYPNFYIILTAKAGMARKGTPIKAAEAFAKTVQDINFIDRTTTERLPYDLSMRTQNIAGQQQVVPCDAEGFLCAEELVAFLGDQSYNSGVLTFLIEWWDCPDEKVTKSFKRGIISLKNICINLLGGTTPAWLEGSLSNLVAGGGMLSRTLFIVEDRTNKEISWPAEPDENTRQRLIQQLAQIDTVNGTFSVDKDALDWNHEWYKGFRRQLEADENEAPALERKQIYMIKLAMILALSEGRSLEITTELLERANRILKEQEKGIPEIARSLMANPLGREHLRVIDQILKAGGDIQHSDLLRKNSPYGMSTKALEEIIKTLEESERIETVVTNYKGRATRRYQLKGKKP